MITIQNGKLIIPDEDRFVGFAGDNSVNTKQFTMIGFMEENCVFTLCMRFDDDTVRSVPLTAVRDHDDVVLTWEVRGEDLYSSGIVQVQVKIADSDGNVGHTTKDFFLIGSAVELDDDGSELEYVTPSQLRNSINQALQEITATSPYVDADGYWCIYDPERGEYVRTAYHVNGIAPDSAMSDSSDNTVGNRVIKQYVDSKAVDCNTFSAAYADTKVADRVPNTRRIAQIALSADISADNLMAALRPHTYRTNITPNSSGIMGQLGIGVSGEVYFCTAADHWTQLANHADLYEKMDLVYEVDAEDIDEAEDGSIFFCGDVLYVKFDGDAVALAKSNDVYSKAEINTMIGNVESLLAAI